MKKSVFMAAVAMAMMASCSQDENVTPNDNLIDSDELVPVEIGVSNVSATVTRAQGTVGGMSDATNVFRGEHIYLLMTTLGEETWGFSSLSANNNQEVLFGPGAWAIPERYAYSGHNDDMTQVGWHMNYFTWSNNARKYYPLKGYSDFFGFNVDDAADADDVANYDVTESTVTIPVIITGTQDLLAGKAKNTVDDTTTGFSAKTARNGKVPTINLKHLLTRLTFSVTSDAETVTIDGQDYDVVLDTIKVIDTYNTANMLIAYDEGEDVTVGKDALDLLEWDETSTADFYLNDSVAGWYQGGANKVVDLMEAVTIPCNANESVVENQKKHVGEAMFIRPNQDAVKMVATFTFPTKGEGGVYNPIKTDAELIIKLPNDEPMQVGTSYNVNILVHGLKEILVNVEVEPWKDGGSFDFDVEGNND